MRRFIVAMLLTSIVVYAPPARSEDVDQPKGTISPLREGQKAPYSGIIFDTRASADVMTRLTSIPSRIKVEVETCRKEETAKCDARISDTKDRCTAEKKILQAALDDKSNTIKVLEEKLKITDEPPSRTLWATVGAVGGITLSVLTVFAINQASK